MLIPSKGLFQPNEYITSILYFTYDIISTEYSLVNERSTEGNQIIERSEARGQKYSHEIVY